MISDFLKRIRSEGMTQEAIAEKTGIPQTLISRYIRGGVCTVETLKKIAKAFNVSTDKVLGLDKPEEPEGRNSHTDNKPSSTRYDLR